MWEKVVSVQYPRYPIPNVTVHRPLRWQLLDFCNDPVRFSFTCPDTIIVSFSPTPKKNKIKATIILIREIAFLFFFIIISNSLFLLFLSASKQSRWFPKTKTKKTNKIFWFWTFVLKNNNFKEPGSVMRLWYETLGFLSLRLWFLY